MNDITAQSSSDDKAPMAERPPSWLGIAARYLYTAGLAVLTLSLVIVTLAAYQFQSRITELEAATVGGGTSKKSELASDLRLLQARYHDFKRYADDRWAVFLAAERNLNDELRPVLYAQIRAERRTRSPWLGPIRELPTAESSAGAAVASPTNHSAEASNNAAAPAPALSRADEADLTSAVEAHREFLNYAALLYELPPDRENSPELFALYQDMLYFDHLKGITLGLIDPMTLAVMPRWMLTLIVTLAMGALGSLLHVTKSFLDCRTSEAGGGKHEYLPLSWFVLRPLLGVVTAFAVFVFLQAGLALTDGTLTQGSDSLNPFFIAFVATLSGLMSWQAIESMERWGARFLGEESIQRWAYGLKGAFAIKPDKTEAELARFLKVEDEQIKRWMDERQPVPQSLQDSITAWFGIDRRHLFSDQRLA
jgi:hypothetical protein